LRCLARLTADILVAAHAGEALTWGAGLDLLPTGEVRRRYIAAHHQADQGNLALLLRTTDRKLDWEVPRGFAGG
jgi:hypothetical protein